MLLSGSIHFVYACKCTPLPLDVELEHTDALFVGEVIETEGKKYTIRIIREWNKLAEKRATNIVSIQQGKTSCTKRQFDLNEVYLFFIKNGAVFNCSRTVEFLNTQDIERLESRVALQSVFFNTEAEYDRLDYERKFVIEDCTGHNITIKDKVVLYIYEEQLITESEMPIGRDWFNEVRYYLIEDYMLKNIDYVFYVENVIGTKMDKPKLSQKIKKQLKVMEQN